jgi:CubicO group peptidase (beta-lactamase class C family)
VILTRAAALRAVAGVLASAALAACGAAPPVAVAPPTALGPSAFNPSGPDAAIYGLTPEGFPRADQVTWWQAPYLVDSHSRLDEIFPAHRVHKPAAPRPLHRAATEPAITYHVQGEDRTLDGYLARHPATGFLLVKDDRILVERYQYDRRDTQRFTSWSMAKTVTSMLVGIAIDEGRIRSIDDRPSEYVPALAGTAYGATPIRHLLTMSSGVHFTEDYSGRDDVAQLVADTFRGVGPGGPAAVTAYNARDAAPGTRFAYASSETQVLGLVLRAAVGRSVAAYLSEKIWQPMGAEADASWLIDRTGQESTYCCLNAVLRDYARLGRLLANDGRVGDRQVIPKAWLAAATTVPSESAYLAPRTATPYFGYGYQTWIFPGDQRMFALLGLRGQAIYVDPASKLVLVHTAVRRLPDPSIVELGALWAGIRRQLAS